MSAMALCNRSSSFLKVLDKKQIADECHGTELLDILAKFIWNSSVLFAE